MATNFPSAPAGPGAPAAQPPFLPAPRGSGTQWATTGAPSGPLLGPLRRPVELPVHAGDRAPRGPPLGPLRRTVERSGGPRKGRNPRQNRGGQNQGRRRGHRAAQITLDTMQAHTPPAKRTLPATIKEHVMCTRDSRSGGAHGVDSRYNAWRSGAPGPHLYGNTARQVVDERRAEVHEQQKPSNDPRNNQHNIGTPTTGHR